MNLVDIELRSYWFAEKELTELWHLFMGLKDTGNTDSRLHSIACEMGVMRVRAKLFSSNISRIAVSLGHEPDAIPMKLTTEECQFLKELALTKELKEVLN